MLIQVSSSSFTHSPISSFPPSLPPSLTPSHLPEGSTEDRPNIRDSLLVEKAGLREFLLPASLSPEDRRNSYASFDGNYNVGTSNQEIPNLIELDARDRSSTSESFKLDPELIERIPAEEGELYTVVTKLNAAGSPSRQPNPPQPKARNSPAHPITRPQSHIQSNPTELETSSGSHNYSHLSHTTTQQQQQNPQPAPRKKQPPPKPQRPAHLNGPYYSEIDEVREGVRQLASRRPIVAEGGPPPPTGKYDQVPPEGKKLVLQPVAPRQSTSDNDMWMSVKWQTLPERKDSDLRRSNSSGALEASISDYTNLTDIAVGNTFVSETQRRHSFSEGEGKMVIGGAAASSDAGNRKSVIPISGGMMDSESPDDLYSVPPDAEDDLGDSDVYAIPPDAENDYVNCDAEDVFHDYQNDQLLDKLLNEQSKADADKQTDSSQQQQQQQQQQQPQQQQQQQLSGPLAFMNLMREKLRLQRPNRTPAVIHSASIPQKERDMASFEVGGREGKLQIGRGDYMAFNKDSWGGRQPSHPPPSSQPPPQHLPLHRPKMGSLPKTPSEPSVVASPQGAKPVRFSRVISETPATSHPEHRGGVAGRPKPSAPPKPSTPSREGHNPPLLSRPVVPSSQLHSPAHQKLKATKSQPPNLSSQENEAQLRVTEHSRRGVQQHVSHVLTVYMYMYDTCIVHALYMYCTCIIHV